MSIQLSLSNCMGEPIPAPAGEIARSADVSPCGLYRYKLSRVWGTGRRIVTWCLVNPSTADGNTEDATSRKLIAYSRGWGYDGLVIVNLFAYRSTDPMALPGADDPIGPRNNTVLDTAARVAARTLGTMTDSGLVIVAWGNSHRKSATLRAKLGPRDEEVLSILTRHVDVHALKLTTDGMPWHPLYLPGAAKPLLYRPRSTP